MGSTFSVKLSLLHVERAAFCAVFAVFHYYYLVLSAVNRKRGPTPRTGFKEGRHNAGRKKALRTQNTKRKKRWIALCLLCNIGLLVFLKYTNFFIRLLQGFSLSLVTLDWLVLPLGISFYTFQSVGYCIDVYRGMAEPEHNFFRYALYVSFFPQISQGPIGRYSELAPQLYKPHSFCYEEFTAGLERMLLGYFKKVVVADQIGIFVEQVYGAPANYSGILLAFATVCYAFQLYADFSGYMDISLGIGRCFNIQLAENFDTPYFSKSIAEFWRRWHISLGNWFRDYLYYSVLRSGWLTKLGRKISRGGHKKASKNITTALGLLITWTTIGFWHGAAWKFVAYGLFHGTFVILAAVLSEYYQKAKLVFRIREESAFWQGFQILRTFFIVCVGYVLFRSGSLRLALFTYQRILTRFFYDGCFNGILNSQCTIPYWIFILIWLIVCFLIELLERKVSFADWANARPLPVRWAVLYVFILSVLYCLLCTDTKTAGAGNFLYFNF